MKKHLLKYFLIVLALYASTGFLWANTTVKGDSVHDKNREVEQKDSSRLNDTLREVHEVLDTSLVVSAAETSCFSLKERKCDESLIIKNWKYKALFLLSFLLLGGIVYWGSTKMIRKGYFKSVPYNTLNTTLLYIARVLVVLFVLFAIFCLIRIFVPNLLELDFMTLGAIGDFSGGVIGTLVAVFGAMYVVKSYKGQVTQARVQTFETTCATMLELHKQNVQEIEIEIQGGGKLTGRKAFPYLVSEYEMIFDMVDQSITQIISENEEYHELKLDRKRQLELAHEISFGYFFYNVDNYIIDNEDSLSLKLGEQVRNDVKNRFNRGLYSNVLSLERHAILGHYYRHLYNMVEYIDTVEHLAQDRKDRYCKIVRSQLSDYEQILLYYNTLSSLGAAWNNPLGMKERDKMCLIAKYRLLKNCPYYLKYHGIQPSQKYEKEIEVYRKEKKCFFETGPQQ